LINPPDVPLRDAALARQVIPRRESPYLIYTVHAIC
jgi:hypothetical protein